MGHRGSWRGRKNRDRRQQKCEKKACDEDITRDVPPGEGEIRLRKLPDIGFAGRTKGKRRALKVKYCGNLQRNFLTRNVTCSAE